MVFVSYKLNSAIERGTKPYRLGWKPAMSEQQQGAARHLLGAREAHKPLPTLRPGIPWRDPKKCFRILRLSSAACTDLFAE